MAIHANIKKIALPILLLFLLTATFSLSKHPLQISYAVASLGNVTDNNSEYENHQVETAQQSPQFASPVLLNGQNYVNDHGRHANELMMVFFAVNILGFLIVLVYTKITSSGASYEVHSKK